MTFAFLGSLLSGIHRAVSVSSRLSSSLSWAIAQSGASLYCRACEWFVLSVSGWAGAWLFVRKTLVVCLDGSVLLLYGWKSAARIAWYCLVCG